jgi:hypothetical protein
MVSRLVVIGFNCRFWIGVGCGFGEVRFCGLSLLNRCGEAEELHGGFGIGDGLQIWLEMVELMGA